MKAKVMDDIQGNVRQGILFYRKSFKYVILINSDEFVGVQSMPGEKPKHFLYECMTVHRIKKGRLKNED